LAAVVLEVQAVGHKELLVQHLNSALSIQAAVAQEQVLVVMAVQVDQVAVAAVGTGVIQEKVALVTQEVILL
jgi:hypothetical protein